MRTMMLLVAGALVGGCVEGGQQGQISQELTGDAGTGSGSGGGTGGVVSHSVWNGKAANMGTYDPSTNTQVGVFAVKWGTGPSQQAHLDFNLSSYDWWTGQYHMVFGTGFIPAADLTFTQDGAHLVTTTGPDFFIQECSYDWWSWGCTNGGSRSLDVTWTVNGQMKMSQSGTHEDTFGKATFRTSGTFSSESTNASGNVAGTSVTNGFGMIQNSHGASVARDVLLAP